MKDPTAAPAAKGDALILTPPLPELPPPVWRRPAFLASGLAAIALAAIIIVSVRLIRARLSRPPSPAVRALAALDRDTSPAGVTRASRDYIGARNPGLPVSMTTEEISRSAVTVSAAWLDLLRACDEAKFAGIPPESGLGARARELILEAEKQFAEAARKR